jgi:hypothetical protein
MAVTTGTVSYIKVGKPPAGGQDYCFFGFVPAGQSQAETLILWSGPGITAAEWVVNNMTLQILRDAFASQAPITVTTGENSATVTGIQVGQN